MKICELAQIEELMIEVHKYEKGYNDESKEYKSYKKWQMTGWNCGLVRRELVP